MNCAGIWDVYVCVVCDVRGETMINLLIYNVHLDTQGLPDTIKAATDIKSISGVNLASRG